MAAEAETFSLLAEATRRFVRDRLGPAEVAVDRAGKVPEHLRAEMREMGLFGLTIPEAYGGMGLSIEQEMRLVVEIGWTAPAFHTVFGGNNGIGGEGGSSSTAPRPRRPSSSPVSRRASSSAPSRSRNRTSGRTRPGSSSRRRATDRAGA